MARDGNGPLGVRAAPDIVARAMPDALAAVGDQMSLELAERRHQSSIVGTAARTGFPQYPVVMDLHVVFEPDEQGWVRATIEELPSVITCAPTLDGARELVRDALNEWLETLTSTERATIGAQATRETLTLSVA